MTPFALEKKERRAPPPPQPEADDEFEDSDMEQQLVQKGNASKKTKVRSISNLSHIVLDLVPKKVPSTGVTAAQVNSQ